MKNRRYRGVIGWIALLLFLFIQASYGQGTTGDFTVSGGTYSFNNNVLTVSSGEVTVSTSGETSQTIKLTGGKLILDGVTIKVTSGKVSPIEVKGTAEINLAKSSTNTLTSTTDKAAGIHVPPGSTVTFTGEGTLTVNTSYSSGIGGKQGTYSCGIIIFELDGTVIAESSWAPAIGTCMEQNYHYSVSGFIHIKRGTIQATGGVMCPGIGTSYDSGDGGKVTILIEGGNITATSTDGKYGVYGIGCGYGSKTPIDIFLLGGNINANVALGAHALPLNTVIVGPDVTISENKTVTDDYNNGFVFKDTPKAAIVKGNPTFPENVNMTFDNGETLTIPESTTLTNNGIITNNGTITGTGTINGEGAIVGAIPPGWTGNIAYITYDLNGGNGTVTTTYHKAEEISSFPNVSGLSKAGYTCLGWNTTTDAKSALTSYTVTEGDNTLYAVWVANVTFTSSPKEITGTVGEAFTEEDLTGNVSNKDAVGGVTFAVKGGSTLPEGFSLAEDGKLTGPNPLTTAVSDKKVVVTVTPKNGAPAAELTLTFKIAKGASVISFNSGSGYSKTYGGAAVDVEVTKTGSTGAVVFTYYTDDSYLLNATTKQPADAGTYYLKAELKGDDNYESAYVQTTFTINKKELTITPDADQFVYTDETATYTPTYQIGGAVDGEAPAFNDGKLGWEDGTGAKNIVLGSSLKLVDNNSFKAANYELKLSSTPVTINVLVQSLTEACDEVASSIANNVADGATDGWHNSAITLTALADFKLKAISDLRSAGSWEDVLEISKEGKYEFKYLLLRNGREESSASEQTLSIQLDQTAPTIKGDPVINNLKATFTLEDATSGIASYSYTLDGGQPTAETPVAVSPTELSVEVSAAAGQHTIAFTIKDAAGNEATSASVSFTLTDPAPPVTPPVIPPVTPTNYYTVTLPEVEGAVTDPVAGDYEVESWSSFIFHLTLAEGYAANSQPIVTTDRGETIEPRRSDGAYVIQSVRQDLVISVSGIIPDVPTGIAGIDGETRIRVVGGILLISVPQTVDAFITDTSGRILRTLCLAPGTTQVAGLHSGIYIVKIAGQEGRKVIVN